MRPIIALEKSACLALRITILLLFSASAASHAQKPQASPSTTETALSDKAIVRLAHDSYYSLGNQGLAKFKVTAAPEWKKYVTQITKAQSEGTLAIPDPQKMAQLEQIQYLVSVGEQDVTVEPFRSGGGEIDDSLNQAIGGMQQMIQGFYTTWLPMVFTNPFPNPDAAYTVKRESGGYRILSKDGDNAAEIVVNKNYLATEMTVDTPKLKVKMVPTYKKTSKGWLLTSIDSDLNGGQIKVFLSIDSKEVQGFQLPYHVLYKVPFANKAGETITVETWFLHYQLN